MYIFVQKRLIIGANLKNQCYSDYMYGKDGAQEHNLSTMEGIFAMHLKHVLQVGSPPKHQSPEHEVLRIFATDTGHSQLFAFWPQSRHGENSESAPEQVSTTKPKSTMSNSCPESVHFIVKI